MPAVRAQWTTSYWKACLAMQGRWWTQQTQSQRTAHLTEAFRAVGIRQRQDSRLIAQFVAGQTAVCPEQVAAIMKGVSWLFSTGGHRMYSQHHVTLRHRLLTHATEQHDMNPDWCTALEKAKQHRYELPVDTDSEDEDEWFSIARDDHYDTEEEEEEAETSCYGSSDDDDDDEDDDDDNEDGHEHNIADDANDADDDDDRETHTPPHDQKHDDEDGQEHDIADDADDADDREAHAPQHDQKRAKTSESA